MDRKKILWLASWYPSQVDPFNGDFIQRHAQAVSLYHDVQVLFVVRDGKSVVTKTNLSESFRRGNLAEKIVYYSVRDRPAFFQKPQSQLCYIQLFKKAIRQYIAENGKPNLVHVHVTLKAGILANWIKKRYGIPYVITEHASVYLSNADERFESLPFYFLAASKHIWKNAASLSTVSNHLREQLKKLAPQTEMRVIPNVVNTTIFNYQLFEKPILPVTFIHISGLGYPKNPESILKAFAAVKQKGVSFQLQIIGPQRPPLVELMHDLGLQEHVFFQKEMLQPLLAEEIRKAHALILYSRYETFGCVVIESNACGIPVIVSDIPAMRETVQEGVNGIFVPVKNVQALTEKILWFINNRERFDATSIARQAHERYSYETVALHFDAWYRTVLKNIQI